ncbi:hypothetical protein DFH28DRAFT_1120848 [Melampsora americana]|nr:hypothetical protein DFH28DRAFT_1120848 [Melampsora americana]
MDLLASAAASLQAATPAGTTTTNPTDQSMESQISSGGNGRGASSIQPNSSQQGAPAPNGRSDHQSLADTQHNLVGTSTEGKGILDEEKRYCDQDKLEHTASLFSRYARVVQEKNDAKDKVIDLTTRSETEGLDLPGSKEQSTQEGTFTQGGIQFDFSKPPNSNLLGLLAFFHKSMTELQGTLSLKIFNKSWQQAASDNHVDYKKKDHKTHMYQGFPYAGEWSQLKSDWTDNMEEFILALSAYGFVELANSFESHQKKVNTIAKERGWWVVAFTYNLRIRKAIFAFRNPGVVVPNPAIEPIGLVDKIYHNVQSNGDLPFRDNPYRKGGEKERKSPYLDLPAVTATLSSHPSSFQNHPSGGAHRTFGDRNLARNGGYQGKNFYPNFKTKPYGNRDKGKDKKE